MTSFITSNVVVRMINGDVFYCKEISAENGAFEIHCEKRKAKVFLFTAHISSVEEKEVKHYA